MSGATFCTFPSSDTGLLFQKAVRRTSLCPALSDDVVSAFRRTLHLVSGRNHTVKLCSFCYFRVIALGQDLPRRVWVSENVSDAIA
jgi:hypothetical protein